MMDDLFTLLNLIKPYVVVPILLAGFYQWRHLPTPFRFIIAGGCLSALIAVLRTQFAIGHAGFYISAVLGVALYGGIFQSVLSRIIDTRLIWVGVALIWAMIGWYALHEGVQKFQLWVIIPYDLFMITFCMIYVVHQLHHPGTINTSVFYLMLYMLMEFFVNLFLDMMSNFLKSYFSDSFMTLLWQRMLPVYNLLRVSVILWIILSVKPKLPSLDKMPSFTS